MRPRSRREIMQSIIAVQQAPARRRRAVLRGLLGLAIAAAAGAWAWQHRSALLAEAKANGRFWEHLAASLAAALPGQGQTPADGGAPAAAAPQAAMPAPATPAAPALSTGTAAQPLQPNFWKVCGQAYDLFSLRPVAKARVTFASSSSPERYRVLTDKAGRYCLRLALLSEGGYAVEVRHRDYLENYLDESDPPYRQQALSRRREAAELMREAEVLHVPVLPPENEFKFEHDLVLLPR